MSIKKTKLILPLLTLSIFLIFPFLKVSASPFGGMINVLIECTCNNSTLIFVGDPVGGEFIKAPGTIAHACEPMLQGEWILGEYSGEVSCEVMTSMGCIEIKRAPKIDFYGTSPNDCIGDGSSGSGSSTNLGGLLGGSNNFFGQNSIDRFFSNSNSNHFFTMSQLEIFSILQGQIGGDWNFEGFAFNGFQGMNGNNFNITSSQILGSIKDAITNEIKNKLKQTVLNGVNSNVFDSIIDPAINQVFGKIEDIIKVDMNLGGNLNTDVLGQVSAVLNVNIGEIINQGSIDQLINDIGGKIQDEVSKRIANEISSRIKVNIPSELEAILLGKVEPITAEQIIEDIVRKVEDKILGEINKAVDNSVIGELERILNDMQGIAITPESAQEILDDLLVSMGNNVLDGIVGNVQGQFAGNLIQVVREEVVAELPSLIEAKLDEKISQAILDNVMDGVLKELSNQLENEVNQRLKPVFRFYSSALNAHFYTISELEKMSIIKNYSAEDWFYEGIAWYAFNTQSGQQYIDIANKIRDKISNGLGSRVDDALRGEVSAEIISALEKKLTGLLLDEVREEVDRVLDEHLSNSTARDLANVIVNQADKELNDWIKTNVNDKLKPVFRFYSSKHTTHFYTISPVERDFIIKNYSAEEWLYEGIAWYTSNKK
ncbi:MAG TPA: hypothetical protein GX706_02800 [Candidatus Moranbacteria bacterium]|nr:hypothetical protein [Candidatus Moranbacteria bacterium]